MKKMILLSLSAVLLVSCSALTPFEKTKIEELKSKGIKVPHEEIKSPGIAGALNLLPGFGNFYLATGAGDGSHWLYGFLNLLTWPISIVWGIPEGAIDAGNINMRNTFYYYTSGPGVKELQAAPTLQPQNDVLASSNLDEGIQKLAEKISGSMLGSQRRKITIVDFSDLNGNVTAFGQFMSEELTTQLFNIAGGKFEVVDRKQLSKLEEELALSQTGVIEEKNIKKMGQVLGVDAIITGYMTDLGNTVRINVKIIGVESAKVLAVAATNIPKTGAVADLMLKQAGGKKPAKSNPGTPAL